MTRMMIVMATAMAMMTPMATPTTTPVFCETDVVEPSFPVTVVVIVIVFLHSFSLKEVMATEQELSIVSS